MPTPNLGLTIPVGGTTPGAANNVTVGSYPYIWLNNLNLIDSETLSIPNNPAKVSNGGIVIDGNLNFGGFGITNASTGAFSSNLTIGGTLGVTGISTCWRTASIAARSMHNTVGFWRAAETSVWPICSP